MSLFRRASRCFVVLIFLATIPLAAQTKGGPNATNAMDANAGTAAHGAKGMISGRVTDSAGAVLQGARIELAGNAAVVSNNQGEFTLGDLAAGTYTVTISYVGFAPFTTNVTVTAGQVTRVDAPLSVASKNEQVIVTAARPHGEAESINRMRTADNIVQVLPAEVITSLPNANIADAVGRLPSVTLERDEGEGKYVQVRGTEPRLTNVTIDGINVPSPEKGVRQIKLDAVAADLVESVEINKTLQANMDGEGIGGSVNLKTKTASAPEFSVEGLGGYTPILAGRGMDQFAATAGKRFGKEKKLGLLFGGSYDYNGRGINDMESVPTADSAIPHYDSMDLRHYQYNRSRYGFAGSADYKLGQDSSLYARVMDSTLLNYGHKTVNTLVDGGVPQLSQDWRRPIDGVGSLLVGGHHVFSKSWMEWDLSVARSRELGGSGGANYAWTGDPTMVSAYNAGATTDMYRPQFTAGPGAFNLANYSLTDFSAPTAGKTAQLNLQGSASYGRRYHLGGHPSTFEFGAKVRNAHKYNNTYGQTWTVKDGVTAPLASQFSTGYIDTNYYDKSYQVGPMLDYNKVKAFVAANSGLFDFSGGPGVNKSDYNLTERVSAGYLMNTIDLASRVRLAGGVRFEGTGVNTLSFDKATNGLTFKNNGSYLDVLPSASLRFALTQDSDVRLVYSRGLARPNPSDLTAAVGVPVVNQTPYTISMGNPSLKAEHANNYDLLFEHYLRPLGMIQAGVFYKQLSDPIIATQTKVASIPGEPVPPSGGYYLVSQQGNAGSAHLAGFEISYQQRLSFLPGPMAGLGFSGNYSYTASEASGIPHRTDHPALLRQAPHTWNISPTYDRGRVSMRVGLSYNDSNIHAYNWTDGADSVGVKGPSGDEYFYSHMQVDAEGTVRLWKGVSAIVSGLNLNNEPFGFYFGNPKYVEQREYYKPTFAFGLRWTPSLER